MLGRAGIRRHNLLVQGPMGARILVRNFGYMGGPQGTPSRRCRSASRGKATDAGYSHVGGWDDAKGI